MRTIIGGGFNCGKTTELIKISAETGYPIVCRSKDMARCISKQASDLGLKIPFPVTYEEFPLKSSRYKAVLVDEIEHLLEKLIGTTVYAGATTAEMKKMPEAVKRSIYPLNEEDEDADDKLIKLIASDGYTVDGYTISGSPTPDPVNNPEHYTQGGIECIDAIEAALTPEEFRGFCKGNALKYIWRAEHKGKPKEDLEKSIWYIDRLTKEEVTYE